MNQINQNFNINNVNNENLKNQIIANNKNLNQNNFYINLNQINLINDIINFYKNNGMDEMNFNQKFQIMNLINHLNPDLSLIKINDEIKDPLYYIHECKINIKLINYTKTLYNVKIPTFITKSDLYSIAQTYRAFDFTKILLVHNNSILNKDESSINNISNNDIIIMIEDRYYPDETYYNSIIENKNSDEMTGITLIDSTLDLCGIMHIHFNFPSNISLSEMFKAIYLKFGRDKRDLTFLNCSDFPYKKLKDKFSGIFRTINISTHCGILGGIFNVYGKKIILNNDNRTIIEIGTLNSNKKLKKYIEMQEGKKLKKLYIDGKEIDLDEEKSLASLGIQEGSYNLKIEFSEYL